VTIDTTGTCSTTNNLALNTGHVKAIVDAMKERNIPPYVADDYLVVSHVSTYRPFKNTLETLNQYTNIGIDKIYNGEIGRYEGSRFIEQTFIPKGGAATPPRTMPSKASPTRGTTASLAGRSSWAPTPAPRRSASPRKSARASRATSVVRRRWPGTTSAASASPIPMRPTPAS
jgi:hypothetical protein